MFRSFMLEQISIFQLQVNYNIRYFSLSFRVFFFQTSIIHFFLHPIISELLVPFLFPFLSFLG